MSADFFPSIVAVVGAGNMGAGIAQKIAQEGFTVLLADLDLERAQAGVERIRTSLDQAVERRIFKPEQAAAVLSRITPVGTHADLADADLVIEAIFENLLVKKELFRSLDQHCKPGCVLATNTSSFYVAELASVTTRPGHVVGLHYFFHPAKNRLLEVIPGHLTDPAVVDAMVRFAEAHGKTGLVCKDAPGFVVNRFFVPWLNEAVRLLADGTADIPTIEDEAKAAFGIGMGPFQLMNVTGIPVALHAAGTLGTELGAFYEPDDRLAEQVASKQLWPLDGEPSDTGRAAVRDRLLGVTFAVAGHIVDEGVSSLEDVDRGARIGLRWAKGPFELMNHDGLAEALRRCEVLQSEWPDLALPTCIAEPVAAGQTTLSFRRVDLDVRDGIAWVRINRPEVLGALDPEVMGQLSDRFDEALAVEGLKGIVLASAGKAFVAGADVAWFVNRIEADDVDGIIAFTRSGQELLDRIEGAPVPVIARVHGLAMGGGVELALACHAIVCSPKASFALPETGIGIYPGLGGTQRLPRVVGRPLARRMIFTGRPLSAKQAAHAGLALDCVELADLDAAIVRHIEQGVPDKYAHDAADDVAVAEAYADGRSPGVAEGLSEPAAKLADKDARALARKAPLALETAARLVDEGAALPLRKGLDLELQALEGIFASEDALIGLRSVLNRERPSWTGR
jgi:enoyl-CoA hydratase / 3-hydroxyacyl-CoA dehydrogenase